MTALSFHELLAGSRPAATTVAIDSDGNSVSLAQFRRDVASAAARLRAISCQAALLACADTYWSAVGLMALVAQGAKAALAPALPAGSWAAYRADGEVLITDQPADDALTVRLGADAVDQSATLHWTGFDAEAARVDLFTSGSTGTPKRVTKTLRQLEGEATIIEGLLASRLPVGSPVHATVPSHHLYGLTFSLVWPLLSGRPFNRQVHQLWETVFSSGIGGAVLVTSPAHLTRLGGFPPLGSADHPALVLSAGAALPVSAACQASDILGRTPTEIFGSTETGAIARRDWSARDLVSDATSPAWTPLPGVTVGVSDDGRLILSSPFVEPRPFLGADLIALEADGRFRALGRADDICKIEGKRISLSAVEQALRALTGIADAAVLVIDDGRPRLAAVIELDAGGRDDLRQMGAFRLGVALRRRLAGALEPASLPKRWRFATAMPVAAMGKRRRADLLALFDHADDSAPSDEPSLRESRRETTATGASKVELDLYIDPNLPQLDGHFPGLPIVPGVALVDWAARFGQRHLQAGDGVARALQVKFRRLIQPGQVVTLVLEHQPAGGKLAFTYRQGDDILASGRIPVAKTDLVAA